MSEVIIKQNWDSPIKYAGGGDEEEFTGYFVGREREVSLLSNDIRRKNEGSILVRGHPGVGKTSLVMRALQVASDEDIIPTFLSGPDMVEEDELSPKSMMRHLARRLYVYTKDRDLGEHNERIQEFYLKAVSESRDIYHTQREDVTEEENVSEARFRLNLTGGSSLIKYLIYGIPFIIGGLTSLSTFAQTNPITPVIITAILLIPFHFLYERVSRYTQQIRVREKAETVYEKDSTLGNLKFDLNKIHRELDEERIIYVIDELDKVDLNNARETLEFFKDFFTASNAIFIFVGGEQFKPENFANQRDQAALRPRSYTYFDSEYYISRPKREDLIRYLNEIIQDHNLNESKLDHFIRALCFDAKNDFFDLKRKIKDRISSFKEDKTILQPKPDDRRKAEFYDAVTVFEEKYSADPSRWEENEKIARRLFDLAYAIFEGHVGMEINDPEGTSVLDQVERDFNQFLHRHGVLTIQNSDQRNIEGVDVPINTYVIEQTEINHSPSGISEPTEFERQFEEKFRTLCTFHLPIVNLLKESQNQEPITEDELMEQPGSHIESVKEVGINTPNQIKNHVSLSRKISDRDTRDLNRQEVENSTNNINSVIDSLKNNPLIQGFANAYQKVCIDENAQITNLQDIREHLDATIENEYENQNPQVIFSKPTTYSPMRVAIFPTDGRLPSGNVARFLKNSNEYCVVIATESNRSSQSAIKLNISNPDNFDESASIAIEELDSFYRSGLQEEVETILTNCTVSEAKRELSKFDADLLSHAFDYEKQHQNRITLLRWLGKRRN